MLPKIPPSRCTGAYDDSLLDNDNYVAEPKLDGARYLLYLEEDGTAAFYSRRDFPRINKAANVPHIARHYPGLEGTILDGEAMLPNQVQLGDTTGLLNMLPKKAVAEQEKRGKIVYHAFDILYYKGQDVRSKPWQERRNILLHVVAQIYLETKTSWITAIKAVNAKAALFKEIVDAGGEGVVLKNTTASYGIGWVKCKRRSDFSAIVTGFQEGKGKYANNLGALIFSVVKANGGAFFGPDWLDTPAQVKRDTLVAGTVEIGKCSGMTDAERTDIWQHRNRYLGRVLDVFAQEVTKDGRLRHPVFHRFRDDVSPETCTWEKLKDDANKAKLKGGDK